MTARQSDTGNFYYGARYYDPKIGVWLSVDAVAAKKHNRPLTPYHFSANNPLNIIDPDGNDWFVNQETGETLYRPSLGKEDASTLGETIAWFASNDDIILSPSDITDGQLEGSYLPGEFEGYNFSTGISKKIMEKNDYKMVPTLMSERTTEKKTYVTNSPHHGAVYSTHTVVDEYWKKVTYAPMNALRKTINSELTFEDAEFSFGSIMTSSRRVSTFSYTEKGSWQGRLQGLNESAKSFFDAYNFGYTEKNVHKP